MQQRSHQNWCFDVVIIREQQRHAGVLEKSMDSTRRGAAGQLLQGFGSVILDRQDTAVEGAINVPPSKAHLDPQQAAADLVKQFSTLSSPQEDAAFKRPTSLNSETSRSSETGRSSVSFMPTAGRPLSPVLRPVRLARVSASHPLSETDAAVRIQGAWRHYYSLCRRSFCQYGDEAMRLVQRCARVTSRFRGR
jgi:hypothetical protein